MDALSQPLGRESLKLTNRLSASSAKSQFTTKMSVLSSRNTSLRRNSLERRRKWLMEIWDDSDSFKDDSEEE